MVILRRTRKLSTALPITGDPPAGSDTALGDWYVNRIVVDRQPLLILVSATSLLPMLVPARDVRLLPDRLAALVEDRLRRLGVPASVIAAERAAMNPVTIGATADRSVLGIMVDFARAVPYHLERGRWDEATLRVVEADLARTPCYAGRRSDEVVFPEQAAPEALRKKRGWLTMHPTGVAGIVSAGG